MFYVTITQKSAYFFIFVMGVNIIMLTEAKAVSREP